MTKKRTIETLPKDAKRLHRKTQESRAKGKAIILTTLRIPEPLMVAADRAGVHRSTVGRWRDEDAEFDAQVKDAVLDGADVLVSVLFEEARKGNVPAINLALRVMGIIDGVSSSRRELEDRIPDFNIEELAQRAIEQGYVSTPKPVKIIEGDKLAKVT